MYTFLLRGLIPWAKRKKAVYIPFGSDEDTAAFISYKLFEFRGWKIKIHRILNADPRHCYHSHHAKSMRIILKGGYTEETIISNESVYRHLVKGDYTEAKHDFFSHGISFKVWKEGQRGTVLPSFIHRIQEVSNVECWTLWICKDVNEEDIHPIYVFKPHHTMGAVNATHK